MLSGALGLQIIARRLGVELGERQFSQISGIDERELNFREIKKIANNHSLVCKAIRTNLHGLSSAIKKQPVLVRLENDRYVIAVKLNATADGYKDITVIDPKASTPKPETIDVSKFKSAWGGKGLIFKKSRKLERESGELSIPAILDDLLEDKWVAIQLVLIIIFINIFALAPIVFLMIVLDKVVNYESYSTLYVVTSGVILAHIFNFLLTYYKSAIINLAAAKIEAKYGMQIFGQIMNLPITTFEKQSGQVAGFGNTLNSIRSTLINKFLGIITDVVSVLLFVPILVVYSPILGAIVVAFCLLNTIITVLHDHRSKSITQQHGANNSKRQALLAATSISFVDIKRLGLEKDIIEEWKTVEGDYLRSNDKSASSNLFISEIGTLLNNLLTVVVLFVGVHLVFAGSLSAGVLIGVNMLIGKIFRPFQTVVKFPSEIKKLSQLLDPLRTTASLSSEKRGAGNYHDILGSVTFSNVTVVNDNGAPVVEDVSFSIEVNDTVGICAENPQSGLALATLIQGLCPLTAGTIMLDGNDINSFNLQHLRANVALIDKTNHFFAGTIRDNFQKVLPNASNQRIEWACQISNFDKSLKRSHISLDDDINSINEAWNDDFRMKFSLARAIIRNPRILIIDDIFSHLTTDSLLEFREKFEQLAKSRTVIMFSRDISNLVSCNKLMFFSGSQLSQYGVSATILNTKGPAKDLFDKQLHVANPGVKQERKVLSAGEAQ
jgi:subfamily B ATP-binding cassette protein HlyB/CyaB